MATAEVRTIVRQNAPGTEPTTNYELGAEVEGTWLAFSVLGVEALDVAKQIAPQNEAAQVGPPETPEQPSA